MRTLACIALAAVAACAATSQTQPEDARDADEDVPGEVDAPDVPDEGTDVADDIDDDDVGEDGEAETTPSGPIVVRDDGFYRDGLRILPVVLWGMPAGVTDDAALAAGFDILSGPGDTGQRIITLEGTGAALAGFVAPYVDDANLVGWLGPDEPAWRGMTVAEVQTGVVDPLRGADPTRPLIINHAPRGTTTEPTNFDLLLPWMPLSDVVAMDIYPVPEGNGHSALAANPGLTAVGAYADILRDLVDRGGHPQPFAMVLLGAGLGRIPPERWEILESFADAYDMAGTEGRGAVACDIDADDEAEIVIAGTTVGGRGVVRAYDFGASPFGDRQVEAVAPADLAMSGLRYLLCADGDGDHRKDVVLVVDGGPTRQDVWVAPATRVGLDVPTLRWRASDPVVVLSVVHHAVAGDFDGDGCDDLFFTYDYPDGRQAFLALPSGCSGFAAAAAYPIVNWYETTVAVLDLEAWPLAAAGDFNGDGRSDLALAQTSGGRSRISVLTSTASALLAPVSGFDQPSSAIDFTGGRLAAADFDGTPGIDLAVAQGTVLTVLPGSTTATFGAPASWYSAGGFDAASLIGVSAGDIDGDGRADLALVDTSPSFTVRIRLAVSTGRFFGARDPTVPELRSMWLSALAHGAAGIVSWCQQFAASTDAVWGRLSRVATELRALAPHLAGETLLRSTTPGRYIWWVTGTDLSLQLVALNDYRSRDVVGVGASLPPGKTGSSVLVWSPASRSFGPVSGVSLSGNVVSDLRPLDPYEVRVYKVVE